MTPAVVLVNPQLPENIGATARAMLNFGLTELRLVAPRDAFPDIRATRMAAGAERVLEAATVYPTSADAVADLHYVLATCPRDREMVKPTFTPRHAMQQAAAEVTAGRKVGILFGPERTGLVNEDVVRADARVEIPTNPEYSSLNLAQAVVVLAYEWFQATHDTPPEVLELGKTTHATREAVEGLYEHLEAELDYCHFFKSPAMKPGIVNNIRNTILRARMTDQEVRTFRGIIRALVHKY
jgi:tRNA/rRNA methyltransferase